LLVSEQIKKAFSGNAFDHIKYMVHDRDSIFCKTVINALESLGIQSKRTDYRCPWQNGIAERWVGNCKRELMDHVIIFNERHAHILMEEYVQYYNEDRTHYPLQSGQGPTADAVDSAP